MRRRAALAAALLLLALGARDPSAARAAGRTVPPRIENRTLSVFGQKIHYLEAGAGRPVILLHGFGGSAESWRTTMSALAADFRLFAPDQVGFGASDKPAMEYSLETLVDFLERFLTVLGLKQADLVGHSMGGRVACLFALAHPERVSRLALLSGTGHRPHFDDEVQSALNFSNLTEARRLLELLYFDDATYVNDRALEELFSRRLRSGTGYTLSRIQESYRRGEGSVDDLSGIGAPTLIVWGMEDEISSVSGAEKAHRQIERSQVLMLERCGHLPMVEAREKLLTALRDFLQAR